MRPEEAELVRYRLARAEESLEAARILIEKGLLVPAVNRVYYACFYAVSALLYAAGLASSKHSGVMALFERHFVRSNEVSVEQGRFYRSLFKRRQRGDYDDFAAFDRAEVEEWLSEAAEFVKTVSAKADQIVSESQEDETPC